MLLGCKMKMDLFQGTCGVKLIHGIHCCLAEIPFCFVSWHVIVLEVSIFAIIFYQTNSFSYRFSYISLCCLSILHRLNKINVEKAVSYIVSCKNLDGGFGSTPGGESHAGQSMLDIQRIIFV
jgi:hypothetical protein